MAPPSRKAWVGFSIFNRIKSYYEQNLAVSTIGRTLDHPLDELVDLLSSVAGLAALEEVDKLGLVGESPARRRELERPKEVVGLLEVRSNSGDFVDEVGAALDTDGANTLLDDGVVGDGDSLLVQLAKPALVNELLDSRSRGVAVCHVRLDEAEHTGGRLVELDERGVVDLAEAEELHDLLCLRRDTDDSANTDDEGDLRLGGDVESTLGLGLAAVGDGGLISGLVFSGILLGGGDGVLLILALLLLGLVAGLLGLLGELGLSRLLLQNGFRGLDHG